LTDNTIGIIGCILAGIVFVHIVWTRWNDSLNRRLRERELAEAQRDSATPDPSGEPRMVRGGLTVRDSALLRVQARASSGVCLHCEKRARYQRPVIREYTPLGDRLAAHLGAEIVRRRRVVLSRSLSPEGEEFPPLLCEQHRNMEVAIQERKLNLLRAAMSEANASIEKELMEHENHQVDEEITAFGESVRKKKPAALAAGGELRSIVGGNVGNGGT
jgi:hypothetical protein